MKIEDLYKEYKQDIFCYLLSLTHNPALSEDLLSDTFLNAIGALPKFIGDSSIKTWLFGIARNMWLQSLRQSKNILPYDELVFTYLTEGIENEFIKKQTVNRIHELINSKDKRTATVVKMRIDGYQYYEIGMKLNMSENSARVIDFRTKKWIKATLELEGLIE